MTDSHGTPLAVLVSAANRYDVNFILPPVFCEFPQVGGIAGRPPQLPKVVHADCGYTSQHVLDLFAWCGIKAEIPQRGQDQPIGLGKLRWPIERTKRLAQTIPQSRRPQRPRRHHLRSLRKNSLHTDSP